jgi:hypothetical protein
LFELNNVVLFLIEQILLNSNKYEEIIKIINSNKYDKNPIIIVLKINDECPFSHFRVKIKILKKYKSIHEIELKQKNIDNLKKFLINIFTPLEI